MSDLIGYICYENEEYADPVLKFMTFDRSVAEYWKDKHKPTFSDTRWNSAKEIICTDDLKKLRAIINGKIGKRKITPEQQDKMQQARKRKVT